MELCVEVVQMESGFRAVYIGEGEIFPVSGRNGGHRVCQGRSTRQGLLAPSPRWKQQVVGRRPRFGWFHSTGADPAPWDTLPQLEVCPRGRQSPLGRPWKGQGQANLGLVLKVGIAQPAVLGQEVQQEERACNTHGFVCEHTHGEGEGTE